MLFVPFASREYDDDNINSLETRYSEYLNSTKQVSDFYRENHKNIFYDIDGSLQIDEITNKIKEIIENT